MLKTRIIPMQLLLGGRLVKTQQFDGYRDVGDPVASSRVYNAQCADELVLLNIDRDDRSIAPLAAILERVSEVCFMPLSVGGGVRSLHDARSLIRSGADKVIINSAAFEQGTVADIASELGSQAVIVALDARREADGTYALYADCGRRRQPVELAAHVARCAEAGAGEFLITSIDRDGTMQGYDLELITQVMRVSPAPVIACGGAGNYEHLKEALLGTGVAAVACGSLFNFTDSNPLRARAYLMNYGIPCKVV